MSRDKDDDETRAKGKRGAVQFLMSVLSAILFSFLVAMCINGYFCKIMGFKNEIAHLDFIYQAQTSDGRGKIRNNQAYFYFNKILGWIDQKSIEINTKFKNEIKGFAGITFKHTENREGNLDKMLANTGHFLNEAYLLSLLTIKIILAKCFFVFISSFVFIFAIMLGAMDGLLSRFIRTQEGGRESTFLFHSVSCKLALLPILILFLYFIAPLAICAQYIVILLGLVFYLFFYGMTSNLKKYW